jgi:hypothetical protein
MSTAIQRFMVQQPGGFITADQVPAIQAMDRLCQVLVRCGACRFVCAIQDLEHLKRCIALGGDYVRDVSFTAQQMEAARQAIQADAVVAQRDRDNAARAAQLRRVSALYGFNENDCSGVFDGSRVISDADPGL